MSWRTLKCSVAMVLFCVGAGWILGQGLAWGSVICNKKQMENNKRCDDGYDNSTYCVSRSTSTCTAQPGSDLISVPSGASWAQSCSEPSAVNTAHCVMQEEDEPCLQKYNCVIATTMIGEEEIEYCKAGMTWEPQAWWYTPKALSPTCTPGS